MWFWIIASIVFFALLLIHLNRKYYILSLCKRVQTVDGTELSKKICIIPGTSIFGNNLDVLKAGSIMKFLQRSRELSDGKSYLMYFLHCPIYNIMRADDATDLFQSSTLVTKNIIYSLVEPLLGTGLLISTGSKWHFRRKLLTPAFHFNILQKFLDIFKDETSLFIDKISQHIDENISLSNFIPDFALNNICETALGIKLREIHGSEEYRKAIHYVETVIVERVANPLMYWNIVFFIFGKYRLHEHHLKIAHDFSSKIIRKRREEYQQCIEPDTTADEYGKKSRYAMLDTLLAAERNGDIDHEGICEEVNTFMFEGYDTTSTCITFALLNLANHPDVQEKCYQELKDLPDVADLTIFDFNKLEYLECVIKETLRLYPSVPLIGRQCTEETTLNGFVLPMNSIINVHIFDILHDPEHFPDPYRFDPSRFLGANSTNRHPFAFVAFSAGKRNCIGQKFAMLEVKVLLAAILKKFEILPITTINDLELDYGMMLRIVNPVQIRLKHR